MAVKSSYIPGNLFPLGPGECLATRARTHETTGMQNASALLSRCSGERKSQGFMVPPSRALAACRRAAAPSPGSTQLRQRGRSRAMTAGAVLPGAWQSTGT